MGDRLPWERPLGAVPGPDGTTTFRVWAPRAREVTVELAGRSLALAADGGVFEGRIEAAPGDDYRLRHPQDPATFQRSLLDGSTRDADLAELYRRLLRLRASVPREADGGAMYRPGQGWIWMDRGPLRVVGNFAEEGVEVRVHDRRELVLSTTPDVEARGDRVWVPPLGGAVLR